MLLPYRVKVSDTKVTHFTPILALGTCLSRSHLRKPVSMKQTNHSRKSEAQHLIKIKISGTFFSGHGVVTNTVNAITRKWLKTIHKLNICCKYETVNHHYHNHRHHHHLFPINSKNKEKASISQYKTMVYLYTAAQNGCSSTYIWRS